MRHVTIICVVLAASASFGQPQGGPGGGGGGRPGGLVFGLDSDWAAICFELKLDGVEFASARAAFQGAYDLRKELLEGRRSGEVDRQMMREEMSIAEEELTESLAKVLSAEQLARLRELRSQRRGGFGFGGRGRPQQ